MKQKVTNKSLVFAIGILVSSMILGIATSIGKNLVAAEVFNSHSHESSNKNGEHSNFNDVFNVGGKEGEHSDEHCTSNDNNDKGPICHDHDRVR